MEGEEWVKRPLDLDGEWVEGNEQLQVKCFFEVDVGGRLATSEVDCVVQVGETTARKS